ncbi:MAG: hypothetical protein PVI83_01210, partial [Lysobacterales bacterium]
MEYPAEAGRKSPKAQRLVEHCLGDFTEQPVPRCSRDRGYMAQKNILLFESTGRHVTLSTCHPEIARKKRDHIDQKAVVSALAGQRAVIPKGLVCWLIR